MAIDYSVFAIPKPPPREKKAPKRIRVKATPKKERDRIAEVRDYVRGRERGRCRCCRFRRGESMHEVRARSLRAPVSKRNSIWVCGQLGNGHECHGKLQRKEIMVTSGELGAEGELIFTPQTFQAAEWMKVAKGAAISVLPGASYEGD